MFQLFDFFVVSILNRISALFIIAVDLIISSRVEHWKIDILYPYMQKELYPRLIQDVQLMISELENVTVLWEELWLSTLQDLHAGNERSQKRFSLFIV